MTPTHPVFATAAARFALDILTPMPPCIMGGLISKFPILRVGIVPPVHKALYNTKASRMREMTIVVIVKVNVRGVDSAISTP